jgi:hypothetical protein
MNDNMLHSMATCLGIDVALIKIMEQGQVSNDIRVFHADLPPPAKKVPLTSSYCGWIVNQRANGGTRQQKTLHQLLTASRTGGMKTAEKQQATSKAQQATAKKQKATADKQQSTADKQQAMTEEQQAKTDKQQATTKKQQATDKAQSL